MDEVFKIFRVNRIGYKRYFQPDVSEGIGGIIAELQGENVGFLPLVGDCFNLLALFAPALLFGGGRFLNFTLAFRDYVGEF